MLAKIRTGLVSAILFFFFVAGLSRLVTAKNGPGLVSGAGNALANLFNNARS